MVSLNEIDQKEVRMQKRLRTNVVPSSGPIDSKAYFIGEAPGEEEDNLVQPFVGPAGQFTNRVMAKQRLLRSDYLFHNIFSQRPPKNNISYFYEDKKPNQRTRLTWEGREHLERFSLWLHKVKDLKDRGLGPNVLVSLGRQAMYHLTGKKRIYKWRGSVLPCTLVSGFKVYPMLHPGHVMRTLQEERVKLKGMKKERAQNALPLFEVDLQRIQVQMEFPDIRYPERDFDVDLTFWELKDKLRWLLEDPEVRGIGVDIETLQGNEGPLTWCIGFSANPDYAFTVPLIKVRNKTFAWSLDEEAELLRLISQLFLHKKKLKIFQGGMYDLAILGRYYGLRCAKGTYADTMYCHHASYPYLWKSLEVLASMYTWEPYYKDEGRVSLGSRTDDGEFRYNCKDSAVTREVYPVTVQNARELATYEGYKRTMSILPSHLGMTIRGVRIDQEGKKQLTKDFLAEAKKAKDFVQEKIGYEINLNSGPQKNRLLYGMLGLELQTSRSTKKATSDKNALNKLRRIYAKKEEGKIIQAMMDYAKFAKLASTYTEMRLDVDGRVRTAYSLISTWRMNSASSPFGGFTKADREGGNLQNIPVRTVEGKMIRRLFIPDPGKVLLCWDRRQAEAMFVAWDARDQTRIKMYLDGFDVHWFNARLIFGIPDSVAYLPKALWRNSITNEEYRLEEYRFIGKTVVHAGNYGMGPYKLQEILALQGFILEFRECKAFLETHKLRNPALLQWQRDIREEVRSTRTLISPIGRKREFIGRMNVNLYNAAYAFKPQNFVGELTELTIQRAWERLNDRLELLMNVHDEGIGQCYPKDVDQLIQDLIEVSRFPIDIHGKTLDIPVDFKVGENWADAKEVKL